MPLSILRLRIIWDFVCLTIIVGYSIASVLMAQRRVIAMVQIPLLYQIMSSAVSTGLQTNRAHPHPYVSMQLMVPWIDRQ
jgi:hypothetical protein